MQKVPQIFVWGTFIFRYNTPMVSGNIIEVKPQIIELFQLIWLILLFNISIDSLGCQMYHVQEQIGLFRCPAGNTPLLLALLQYIPSSGIIPFDNMPASLEQQLIHQAEGYNRTVPLPGRFKSAFLTITQIQVE